MRVYQRGERGTWWVDFTVPGRPRFKRSAGTTDRRKAEEWAAQANAAEWRAAKLGERPTRTWGEAVTDWMLKHAGERRAIEDMKDRLRWLTKHIGESTQLQSITRGFVERIMDAKRAEGIVSKMKDAKKRPPPRPVKPKTLNNYVGEISKILGHARTLEWIDSVPALRVYATGTASINWLSQDEADALLAELPPHLALMAELALATGLRESNVRLLRWKQVNLAARMAWVNPDDAKEEKAIGVPLNPDAIALLRGQEGKHPVWVFPVATKRLVDGEVKEVVGPVSGCSTPAWYKATRRAGVAPFRWHDLRHTWASWHVQAGTPLPVLQQLGGWASLEMVQKYAHLGRDHTAAYADAVSRSNGGTTWGTKQAEEQQVPDSLGWLMGLEPTTTGITTRRVESKVLNLNDALARKRRKVA